MTFSNTTPIANWLNSASFHECTNIKHPAQSPVRGRGVHYNSDEGPRHSERTHIYQHPINCFQYINRDGTSCNWASGHGPLLHSTHRRRAIISSQTRRQRPPSRSLRVWTSSHIWCSENARVASEDSSIQRQVRRARICQAPSRSGPPMAWPERIQ